MNMFYLFRNKNGRVVLDSLPPENLTGLIRTVEAADWRKARAQINSLEFEYREGHGFF